MIQIIEKMLLPQHLVIFIDMLRDLMAVSAFGCCLLLFVIVMTISGIYKKMKSDNKTCEQCGEPIDKRDSQCQRCGNPMEEEDRFSQDHPPKHSKMSYEKDRSEKKSRKIFPKIFSKKKVCQECGTELVYRKAYDSWYCPECHTYK